MIKFNGRTEMFTVENCNKREGDYNNKIVLLSPKTLNAESQRPELQIFLATGGFGCNPESLGNAVYGEFLHDGERCRWERYNIIGVANYAVIQELIQSELDMITYLKVLKQLESIKDKAHTLLNLNGRYELPCNVQYDIEALLDQVVTSDFIDDYVAHRGWRSIQELLSGITSQNEDYFLQESDGNFTNLTHEHLNDIVDDVLELLKE